MPRNRTRRHTDSAVAGTSSTAVPPRSKAGCWTCRIRRKRCDEIQNDSGSCQACVRLNIECLGWGTRRPEWCRDKEKLSAYKLQLKKKLCSRAGTRPSANNKAAASPTSTPATLTVTAIGSGSGTSTSTGIADAPLAQHPKVARAPSGESPRSGTSSVAEDSDRDPEELETDDYTSTSTTPFTVEPFFFSSLHPHQMQLQKPKPAPLNVVAPKLHQLLSASHVPPRFASVLSQLVDIHFLKGCTPSPNSVEHEVARRAQAIELELNRLSHRASFDTMLSSVVGFNFDPFSFLSSSSISTLTASPASFGDMTSQYNTPMTTWSPDLMSDAMSTFSGSSAPTSPAAPFLPMGSTSYPQSTLNGFLNFDAQIQQPSYASNYSQPFGSLDVGSSSPSAPVVDAESGALGLTNDFMFNHASTSSAPSLSLFPPTRSSSLHVDYMSPKPPAPAPAPTDLSMQDADPFHIHYETCMLLLQAVLSNDTSPVYDSSPFTLDHQTSAPLEECMQRLISKFDLIIQGQNLPREYAFSATLAGAMSTSDGRRAFFANIVKRIEGQVGLAIGSPLLAEAWAQ